jgi:hypothetical protein
VLVQIVIERKLQCLEQRFLAALVARDKPRAADIVQCVAFDFVLAEWASESECFFAESYGGFGIASEHRELRPIAVGHGKVRRMAHARSCDVIASGMWLVR